MRKVAIVLPTHNRAGSLRRALSSLVAQRPDMPGAAVIVVDNNSSDDTPSVCREFAAHVRYVREPRQGLSFARNTGVEVAAAMDHTDVVAFIDDDVEAAPGWLTAVVKAFEEHPDVDCVGGRVLPDRPDRLPGWITRDHWGPLALQDHGDRERVFDERSATGLIGANFAFCGDVFRRIGGFSPDVQRVGDGIGSTEDHEFLRRLYAAGGKALYTPAAVVITEVPTDRMTHRYHRRWHRGHGRFHALMRTPEVERTRGRVLGVPLHLFRSAMRDALTWTRLRLAGDAARAFAAETRLWFFSGFLEGRCGWLLRR
jgi:glycosyltransferase involved in cell wall biosynthesis